MEVSFSAEKNKANWKIKGPISQVKLSSFQQHRPKVSKLRIFRWNFDNIYASGHCVPKAAVRKYVMLNLKSRRTFYSVISFASPLAHSNCQVNTPSANRSAWLRVPARLYLSALAQRDFGRSQLSKSLFFDSKHWGRNSIILRRVVPKYGQPLFSGV